MESELAVARLVFFSSFHFLESLLYVHVLTVPLHFLFKLVDVAVLVLSRTSLLDVCKR